MKSLLNRKTWIILLAFAALIGLVVLASGLSGMKFEQPRTAGFENFFRLSNDFTKGNTSQVSWFPYFVISLFFLLFIVMLGPIRPQTSRSLFSQILRFFASTFLLMLIIGQLVKNNPSLFGEGQALTALPGTGDQPQQFESPQVSSQWEFWITSLIVIAIGVVVVVVFNRFVDRWFQPKTGLDEIAEIARSALNDLSKNKESRNVIIRSYMRMNAAVDQYRGLTREEAMTPAEFAEKLEKAGLPGEAINGLTRVFEKVRYGGQRVSAEEIKEAKQCLTGILQACEVKR